LNKKKVAFVELLIGWGLAGLPFMTEKGSRGSTSEGSRVHPCLECETTQNGKNLAPIV
jgi:hypothetical protein